MMSLRHTMSLATLLCLLSAQGHATTPEAAKRSYVDNFKDMVLAQCTATAYQSEKDASIDARISAEALMEWTRYDVDEATDKVAALIDKFLARNYKNPLIEYKNRRFDFLKCLDMYRSNDLEELAKSLVLKEPNGR